MSVRVDGDIIRLVGACGADDADDLQARLLNNRHAIIDISGAERLHTALWQIMLVAGVRVSGKLPGTFTADTLLPALGLSATE